jgi:hypothetical protein
MKTKLGKGMVTQSPVKIMVERLIQRSPPMLQSHGP